MENPETPTTLPPESSNLNIPLNKMDFTLFKNEVYKILRDTETKLSSQINDHKSKIENDFSSISSKIDTVIENNKTMYHLLPKKE